MSAERRPPDPAWLGRLWQPPRAQLTHSVNQAVAVGQTTFLAFDTPLVNVGGLWSAAANTQVDVAVAGWYDVWAQVDFANGAGTYRSLAVRLNGTTIVAAARLAPAGGGVDTNVVLAFPIELAARDSLQLRAGQDTAAPLNAMAQSPLSPFFAICWRCAPHRN